MSGVTAILLGGGVGLFVALLLLAIITHPPETYRKSMGYRNLAEMKELPRAGRRNLLLGAAFFAVIVTAGSAGALYVIASASR